MTEPSSGRPLEMRTSDLGLRSIRAIGRPSGSPVAESTELTEDQFYEQYKPIPNPRDGSDFWDYDLDREAWTRNSKGANHLWTCVDGDDGSIFVLNGWHLVNRFAFMVTEVPWRRVGPDGLTDIVVQFDD